VVDQPLYIRRLPTMRRRIARDRRGCPPTNSWDMAMVIDQFSIA
jgi:hypothetical protein